MTTYFVTRLYPSFAIVFEPSSRQGRFQFQFWICLSISGTILRTCNHLQHHGGSRRLVERGRVNKIVRDDWPLLDWRDTLSVSFSITFAWAFERFPRYYWRRAWFNCSNFFEFSLWVRWWLRCHLCNCSVAHFCRTPINVSFILVRLGIWCLKGSFSVVQIIIPFKRYKIRTIFVKPDLSHGLKSFITSSHRLNSGWSFLKSIILIRLNLF